MLDHFRHGEAIIYAYLASMLLIPLVGVYLWIADRVTKTTRPPMGWGNILILLFGLSVIALTVSVTLISFAGASGCEGNHAFSGLTAVHLVQSGDCVGV